MTALNTSVGADDGQSLKSHVNSISENSKDFNDYEENILKMQQEFYRQMDPHI